MRLVIKGHVVKKHYVEVSTWETQHKVRTIKVDRENGDVVSFLPSKYKGQSVEIR